MTKGLEHYRESEMHLEASGWQRQQAGAGAAEDLACAMHEAAVAQVHATLALAAVTPGGGTSGGELAAQRDDNGALYREARQEVEQLRRELTVATARLDEVVAYAALIAEGMGEVPAVDVAWKLRRLIAATPGTVREARVAALRQARELLNSLDHDADDLIIVADWLVTGRVDTALAFARQRTQSYIEVDRERHGLSPDAATWTAPRVTEHGEEAD